MDFGEVNDGERNPEKAVCFCISLCFRNTTFVLEYLHSCRPFYLRLPMDRKRVTLPNARL
jgi:aspartyl/asparaginyl-tRNA synthetase